MATALRYRGIDRGIQNESAASLDLPLSKSRRTTSFRFYTKNSGANDYIAYCHFSLFETKSSHENS